MTKWNPISLEGIKTYPLGERSSKVSIDDFGRPWSRGGDMREWLGSLPGILAASDFTSIYSDIVEGVFSSVGSSPGI